MALESGRDIAHYHVVGKIGAGGMGEVYRATDRKLARDVALKSLPAELSQEPERLARFQREAQLLASLNHPNIAAIYGFEQVADESFLVLELVEGADLAELLSAGPLPVDRALDVARQIAEALEAAHDRGVVHRDLKPANVKLTPDGKVKVLDFGLAKALQPDDAIRGDASHSPTITSLSTRAGVILGTAAYMSPEQARGGPVDRRVDVWAFGCVLLELLTGGSPFHEPTISDTLASILRSEPDWEKLPRETPAAVRRLLRRCLDKDPRHRLRDIGEARVVLEDWSAGRVEETAAPAGKGGPVGKGRGWAGIAGVLVLVALTAVGALSLGKKLGAPAAEPQPRMFEVTAGFFQPNSAVFAPDGRKIALIREGSVWVRFLDRLDPVRLEGTEGASHAIWSRDSESVLFAAHGDLRSIAVLGGTPRTLAFGIGELGSAGGIDTLGDRVVFASGDEGIHEVSLRGGKARVVLAPDGKNESDFHEPSFLPDGSILYCVHRGAEGTDTIAVNRDGRTKYVVQTEGSALRGPVYSPTGHLIYHQSGARAGLWAAPFSIDSLELTGEPFLITTNGNAPSVAADGTLIFVRNAGEGGMPSQLVWVERDGKIGAPVGAEMDGISAPALSPDGKRVVVMTPETEPGNLWIFETDSAARTRLTFGARSDWDPIWTPDGQSIIYWDGTTRALSRIRADGTGQFKRLVMTDYVDSGNPTLSPDGRWMAFWARNGLEQDILALDLQGDGKPVPVVATPAIETFPHISPDGRFLAYCSNESGRYEVYLTRFPSGEGRWQVSVRGGLHPLWSPAGGELFFLDGSVIQSVKVTLDSVPRFGEPVALFDAVKVNTQVSWNQRYEISRDGRRFLLIQGRRDDGAPPAIVVHYDWLAATQTR